MVRLFVLFLLLASCQHVKPYQKEDLTRTVMQDNPFPTSLSGSVRGGVEKLNCEGLGTATANCPTCGG